MSASLSIDRSSLSLSPLEVAATPPAAGLWVITVGRPEMTWRRTLVTSDSTHGASQTAAVLEQSSLPSLSIGVKGSSVADLQARCDELEQAVWQFTFDATITEAGVSRTWACLCGDVKWNDYQDGMAGALVATANLTIPVYPIPS